MTGTRSSGLGRSALDPVCPNISAPCRLSITTGNIISRSVHRSVAVDSSCGCVSSGGPADVDISIIVSDPGIDVCSIGCDIAIDDRSVDGNSSVIIVDVITVLHVDIRARCADPTDTGPAVVINSSAVPVIVAVKPDAQSQSSAKCDQSGGNDRSGRWTTTHVHDIGIILRDINVPGLRGDDQD